MSEDVRAECKRRFGDEPCSTILNALGDVIDTRECSDWCPLLRRLITDPSEEE